MSSCSLTSPNGRLEYYALQTSVNLAMLAVWLPQLGDVEAYRKRVWSVKGDLEKHLY